MYEFKYLELTGESSDEILRRAKHCQKAFNEMFGPGEKSLQQSIDDVIDAAIEYHQGRV